MFGRRLPRSWTGSPRSPGSTCDQGGHPGGKPPQDAARRRRGRARDAGQARRPPAQHADAGVHERRKSGTASRRRRWTSTRRSPAAWACSWCAKRWRIWLSAEPRAGGLSRSSPSAWNASASPRAWSRRSNRTEQALADRRASRRRSAAEKRAYVNLLRKMERKSSPSISSRTFSVSGCWSIRSMIVTAALGIVHQRWIGAGPFQGLHLLAQAE